MNETVSRSATHNTNAARTLGAVAVLLVAAVLLLWWNLLDYYQSRSTDLLNTWSSLELQIAQSAARNAQTWLSERLAEPAVNRWQAEQEVNRLFIGPVRLLQNGRATFFNRDYIIFDPTADIPAEFKGKNIAEIFALLKSSGASHYEDLVDGVTNGKEGTGWFIRSPKIGQEFAAWSSFALNDTSWTVVVATPREEILNFSNFRVEFIRSLIGTVSATLMLGIILFLIFNQWQRSRSELNRLEKAVKERTEDLLLSEERYRTLVEQITAITYIDAADDESTTLFISPQIENVLGYTPEEWYGNTNLWAEIMHPEDRERVLTEHRRTNQTGETFRADYRLIHKDGRVVWIRDEATMITKEGGKERTWQGVMYDITSPKRLEEKLRFLSNHDSLTGLYNRAFFEEEMKRLQQGRSFPISMVVIDVDGLKWVNDLYGHPNGDRLLKHLATLLRRVFRTEDVVARMGGDEFAVILPATDGSGAQAAVDRIRAALEQDRGDETWKSIDLSIGCATGEKGAKLAEVFKLADDGMYREKAFKRKARGTGSLNR